jgi:tRNA-dihydrouridine synthase A
LIEQGKDGKGLKLNGITRHMLGLTMGMIGARAFRQTLSDTKKLAAGNPELLLEAMLRVQQSAQDHEMHLITHPAHQTLAPE